MWTVELEPEVEKWMLALPMSQFSLVLPLVERHQIQRARHALTRCQTEHFGKDHTS
jgi:hypothetical protein